ncbi:hypothetical protein ACF0H5_024076 [Mactra antiquata]
MDSVAFCWYWKWPVWDVAGMGVDHMGCGQYQKGPVWCVAGMGCGRYGMWSEWDVTGIEYGQCGILTVWDVASMGCGRYGCLQYGMWPVWCVAGMGCGRYGMWSVWDVTVMGCDRYRIWTVWHFAGIGSGQNGMWPVWVSTIWDVASIKKGWYGVWPVWDVVASSTVDSSRLGKTIGGVIGGIIAVGLIVLGVVILIRKISKPTLNEGDIEMNDGDHKPTKSDAKTKTADRDKCEFLGPKPNMEGDNDHHGFSRKINVVDLYNYVMSKTRDHFMEEFEKLPKSLIHSCDVAKESGNIAKNRFRDICPYDHSRVTIPRDKNFYMNACYIHGYRREKAYIASLGPTRATTENFASFWKMVWHEKSDVIVMLTNLKEPSGTKCEQYWPNNGESLTFEQLNLTCDCEEIFSEYVIRSLTLSKNNERCTVTQLHFTAWPDKTVPGNLICIAEFRQKVRGTHTLSLGPVIVHCSAGIGRTGTYIAVDILTEEGLAEDSVNVFRCIRNMRDQRVNMVQTPEQYEYVHRAIVYILTLQVDYFTTDKFEEHVFAMNDQLYSAMLETLNVQIEADNDEETEAVAINSSNKKQNRLGSDIPGDNYRPRLYLNRDFNASSYINAVYVDSLKNKNQFLLAQTPLSSTVADFLVLVYQENVSRIVSLLEPTDSPGEDIGTYLPDKGQALTCDSFVVSNQYVETNDSYCMQKLKIVNKGTESGDKIIDHFQYTKWSKDEIVPSDSTLFCKFIKDIQLHSTNNTDVETTTSCRPILIHCLTGGERSGLFCAIAMLLEQADLFRQMSVVNTVRRLKQRRPNVIPNKEQLKFLHDCLASEMDAFCTYANLQV